jgi:hypothetical protein
MGAVVDGSAHDVEPTESPAAPREDGETASERRRFFRRRASPPPTPPSRPVGRARRRRSPSSAMFAFLRRAWLPLVIAIVVAVGGFTISRLHSIFGSVNSLSYGDTKVDEGPPINPKILRYEVFGPPGTVAQISYFDENGNPKFIEDVPLPWSVEFPITTAASVGSVAANGNSDSLGCRILVDDVVKSESIKQHPVSTFTSCMLKAA